MNKELLTSALNQFPLEDQLRFTEEILEEYKKTVEELDKEQEEKPD